MRTKIITQERADAEVAKRPVISRKYTTPEARLEWWASHVQRCYEREKAYYHSLPPMVMAQINKKRWDAVPGHKKQEYRDRANARNKTEKYKRKQKEYIEKNRDKIAKAARERYIKRKKEREAEGKVDRRVKYATEEERQEAIKQQKIDGSRRQNERLKQERLARGKKKPGRKPKYATEEERKAALREQKKKSRIKMKGS